MLRRALCHLLCRLTGHLWKVHEIPVAGVLTVVPRCTRCGRVDIDRIQQSPWNRKARRRRAKQLGMR